jgi:hypothetical protein
LFFQLTITCVVLAIQGGFSGAVPLVVFYITIGACSSLSLGLFLGSIFNTSSSAVAVSVLVSIIFILGGIFVDRLGQILGYRPILTIAILLPSDYLADGVVNASQNLGTLSNHLVVIINILGSSLVLLAISGWILKRQSKD